MSILTGVALMLACVAAEAFFSGSEIAMVHANRIRLQTAAEQGHRGARLALDLLEDEAAMLGTCLIGTNLCTVSGATIAATMMLSQGIEAAWAPAAAFIPLTLIFGEALPKTVMQHHADRVTPWLAWPLTIARQVFTPLLWVVRAWNRVLTAVIGGPSPQDLSRQELLQLLDAPGGHAIDPEEKRLILGVLGMSGLTVEACMTPLVQVVAVDENATVGVAAGIAARTQHSRLPVYRRRIDHIVGVIHQVDLLFLPDDGAPLADQLRPVRFVPDVKRADALLYEMRESGEHFVVAVDEYGGCVGIVTLEDLLEQFVGEIEDERDRTRPGIVELPDGSWRVPGATELDDLATRTGLVLPEADVETIAGLVLSHLGRIPEAGEEIAFDEAIVHITEATDRAIRTVRVARRERSETAV